MIKAKKKYGQNFLKDNIALKKITEAIPFDVTNIIEIGPGLGDLTKKLVRHSDVFAYEIDPELYEFLQLEFQKEIASGRLKLVLGNVLSFWNSNKLMDKKYALVANLPYYIATNIILRAFADANCSEIIVMVQREVAEKFIAQVGSSNYSALSILCELSSVRSSILFTLPPSAFEPMPKVESAVLFVQKKKIKPIGEEFKCFLGECFLQPRKTLMKNLSQKYEKELVSEIFLNFQLSILVRPHEVHASLYSLIYERIKNGNY